MALIGNCTHTVYTVHETETITETVTQPDGTTETVERSVVLENDTDYNDVYLCITKVDNINFWFQNHSPKVILYQYAAYADAETRNADKENFLFRGDGQLINYDYDANLYAQIYNDIKLIQGYSNLIKD